MKAGCEAKTTRLLYVEEQEGTYSVRVRNDAVKSSDNPHPNLSVSIREAEIIRLLFVATGKLAESGYNLAQLDAMVSEAFDQLLHAPRLEVPAEVV